MVSGGRPTIFYVPGSWPALVSDHAIVLAEIDPSGPAVAECWTAMSSGESLDGLLERLEGARSLTAVGLQPDGLRVVARGHARAEVVRPGSAHPLVVAAEDGAGQTEQRVTGVLEIRLLAPSASGQGPRLPMTSGVSLASALSLLAPGVAATPTTPPTETVPRLPGPPLDAVSGPAEPPPSPVPPIDIVTRPADPDPLPPDPLPPDPLPPGPPPVAPSLPWRAPEAFVPDDDSGTQPVYTADAVGPLLDDRPTGTFTGPLGSPAPADGTDVARTGRPPGPRYDEPRYGSPDWAFVSPPTPAQSADRTAEPPLVQAVLCENGHLNAPFVVGACRVCGAAVPPQQPFATQRPTMGRLLLSSGGAIPLDRDVVLGRAPFVVDPDGSHVISVPSPNNDISRSHVRFGIDGWLVQVTDLGSTNGTLVTVPGQQPVRLRPHDPFTILPGTTISLADEVTVLFEVVP